jgi:hypothetical protein
MPKSQKCLSLETYVSAVRIKRKDHFSYYEGKGDRWTAIYEYP